MEYIPDNFVGIVAIIFTLGLPIIAVVMSFWSSMHKKTKDKEVRQLIIENHTDPETAMRELMDAATLRHTNSGA